MTAQKSWDYLDTKTVVESYQLFTGELPLESQMEGLINFVDGQQAYYASQGMDPTIGGFEAMGVGLATSYEADSVFASIHNSTNSASQASDFVFIVNMYSEIYDHGLPEGVRAHYQAQLDYFENLYANDPVMAPQAVLYAHAAVAGQMLAYAHISGDYASDFNTLGDIVWADATNSNGWAGTVGSTIPFDQNGIAYYGIT